MICSISSREKPWAWVTCEGRIFFHTLMMRRVKVTGNWIRNTVERNLNKLKSSRFRVKTLCFR